MDKELQRNFYYMMHKGKMCDGMTEQGIDYFSILYPLFTITGIYLFLKLIFALDRVRNKIKNENTNIK